MTNFNNTNIYQIRSYIKRIKVYNKEKRFLAMSCYENLKGYIDALCDCNIITRETRTKIRKRALDLAVKLQEKE